MLRNGFRLVLIVMVGMGVSWGGGTQRPGVGSNPNCPGPAPKGGGGTYTG